MNLTTLCLNDMKNIIIAIHRIFKIFSFPMVDTKEDCDFYEK